jgi:putative oxidoreductase
MKAPFLIGRLLFAGFFINSGINHLQKRKEMAEYARSKGVPEPELAVMLSAIPLLAGGASLLLGVKPKLGAMALLGFLAGVSPVMHDFWRNQDPQERNTNMIMFMKNMALAGGALALMGVNEPWEASVQPVKPSLVEKVRRAGRRITA